MTIHRIDDKLKSGLTKLERVSRRATLDTSTVFNNLLHVIDEQMLSETYQELDEKKAVGIDKVTKEFYGINLKENISNLILRVRRGTYRPKPSRIVEISKDDGSLRPLAISCFEDKLVQLAVGKILNVIYEPIFLPSSYGFRPGTNCHEALRALSKYAYEIKDGAVIEIDIRKYFNTISHEILREILEKKVTDKRFLKLIHKLIQAPTMVDGKAVINTQGCSQGSCLSPILANVYLHYVIDDWLSKIKGKHLEGRVEMVRYADDMVFIFEKMKEAQKFYQVLPKRLNKFGLELHADKSHIIPSGTRAAAKASLEGKRLQTYKFLGFTCYWGKARKGFWRLKYISRADRFTAKLKEINKYLRENLSTKTLDAIEHIMKIVKGWINYHAISDNHRRVASFLWVCRSIMLKWINRKGGKRKMNWIKFMKFLKSIKFPDNWKTISMFPN